jgi:hypothetical protein
VALAGAVEPLVLLEADDLLGDEAAVPLLERIVGRREPAVGLGEPRVAVKRPRLGDREVDLGRGRPVLVEEALDPLDRAGDPGDDGVAVLGVVDRVPHDLGERQRPVLAQHRDPAAEGAGHDGGERPGAGDEVEPELVAIEGDRGRARRRALRAEDERPVSSRRPEERGQVAAGAVQVRLDDLQGEPGRDRRVEGVPALFEHGHSGRRGEPVRGRHHPEGPPQLGARREAHRFRTLLAGRQAPAPSVTTR